MANWQNRIDISKPWNSKDLSPREIGIAVAKAIRDSKTYGEHEILKSFALRFSRCKTLDGLDRVYNELCDWGDLEVNPYEGWLRNKMCWINVF